LNISLNNTESIWLGLMIGNSRLHWAVFIGDNRQVWDTDHLSADAVEQLTQHLTAGIWPREIFPQNWVIQLESTASTLHQLPLYLASVVPTQTALWQAYPQVRTITLDQIPLKGLYPTLGVDRALAVWGAGVTWGWPVLVIDAGTALTFTGADSHQQLIGGAILPGLRLQLKSLAQKTAALPEIELPDGMPQRWALNTSAAIQSGIIYTVVAGIRDFITAWWQEFPDSKIVLTGGDRTAILTYLQTQFPQVAAKVTADPYVIFQGMRLLGNG
jgi:type III pantothenate kinase